MISRLTNQVFRLLFVLLCQAYRIYMTVKGLVCGLANLLFNRQSRYKIFPFLRIDEDEVINRMREMGKLPPAIAISVHNVSEEQPNAVSTLSKMVLWSMRLQIKHVTIFVLSPQSALINRQLRIKLKQLTPQSEDPVNLTFGETFVKISTFQEFYHQIARQVNKEGYINQTEYKSPLLVIFNRCRSLAGMPFEYLVSGQILLEENMQEYNIIDFQRNLKEYALTKQRCGK